MTSSGRTPARRNTRRQYNIKFSPYLWVKTLDMATPTLHVVTEVIADVVDPDGGHCWLTYNSIAERACYVGHSSVKRAINTLCEFSVARKVTGDERFRVLDEADASYDPKQPPTVVELLIPASAYAPEDLARVNLMRSDRGLPAITAENRPDITGPIGNLAKGRSDKGKSAPQRRRRDVRQAEAEFEEEQPSLYSAQDTGGTPEAPHEDPPGSVRPRGVGLTDPGTGVSETPNPYELYPRDADPSSIPSVGAQPQGGRTPGHGADGTDESEEHQHGEQAPAGRSRDAEASAAEQVVDGLLRDTAGTARPLADPVGDREHLVALARAALERGMSPARLREITSVGLHNVRRQWALTARLADPEAFATVKQPAFGGRPMGGPAPAAPAHPRCATHPTCSTLDAQGRCAECAEAERVRALEEGEVVEYRYDAREEVWRDHNGDIVEEFQELGQDQVQDLVTEREQSREEERQASREHAAATAAAIRQRLNVHKAPQERQSAPAGLAGILAPPLPGEGVGEPEDDPGAFAETGEPRF